MSNNQSKTVEKIYEDVEGVSYDTETGTFTIKILDDISQMYELYRTNPVVHQFVQQEINMKKEYVHEIPRGNITGYEVAGFFWFHAGEEYTIDPNEYYG